MKPEDYLNRAKEYAKSRGGECLAQEYISSKTKTHWKCSNPEHPMFETDFQIIKRGNWCVSCHREEVAKKYILNDGLAKAYAHAKNNEGLCLSTAYKNVKTKLKWQCKNNHNWESSFEHAVTRNRWCVQCHYDKALDKNFDLLAEAYAKDKKGTVILPEDGKVKTATILTWSCENSEHKSWKSSFHTVVEKKGWCPSCAGKFTLEEYLKMAHNHAHTKGGKCLSIEYVDQRSPMLWQCMEHGQWEEEYRNVVSRDLWCRKCRDICTPEEYLEQAKEYALSKNGKCLSTKYIEQRNALIWSCHKHGEWKSDYSNIVLRNRWCPTCFKEKQQKICLDRAHTYAQSLGGKCLTNNFINSNDLFEWKCDNIKHKKWSSKYNIVLGNKSWCPECGVYYQKENQVRKLFEYLLGYSFEKAKPKWNINPRTGFLLELDGYNETNKIAFEYQGRQHYQDNVFKNSNQTLEEIQFKDKIKAEHCTREGIKLIIIDGRIKLESSKRMLNFLQQLLKNHFITHDKIVDLIEVEKIYNSARIQGWDSKNKKRLKQ